MAYFSTLFFSDIQLQIFDSVENGLYKQYVKRVPSAVTVYITDDGIDFTYIDLPKYQYISIYDEVQSRSFNKTIIKRLKKRQSSKMH